MGTLLLVALPASFYAAVHWVALASWTHLWSLLILGAAPWCFLLALEGEPPALAPAPAPAPTCQLLNAIWSSKPTLRVVDVCSMHL